MTEEERAFCLGVHRQAMELYGLVGLIDVDAEPGSRQQKRATKAALAAMALATESLQRVRNAEMVAEQAEVASGGYDLAALATAAPSPVKE